MNSIILYGSIFTFGYLMIENEKNNNKMKKIHDKNKIKEDFMRCMKERERIVNEKELFKLNEKELQGCMNEYLLFLSSNSFL